jgi:hypothetical protein
MLPPADAVLVRVAAAAGDGKGGAPPEAVVPAAIGAHGGVTFSLPAGDVGLAIAGAGAGDAHVTLSVDGGKSWSAAGSVKMVKK